MIYGKPDKDAWPEISDRGFRKIYAYSKSRVEIRLQNTVTWTLPRHDWIILDFRIEE